MMCSNVRVVDMAEQRQVTVTRRDGSSVVLLGSAHGQPGRVFLLMGATAVRVVDPERFGPRFDADYGRSFIGEAARYQSTVSAER